MNDKIRRFTTQLSEAAPLAPELEGRTMSERGFSPATTLTATRIGLAFATVAVLGFVAVTVSGGDDRSSVVPASGQTPAAIFDAIQTALPAGLNLEFIERRDSPDTAPAHAVAINDRLEVLDIEFMALVQPEETPQPDATSPDTGPTVNVSSDELITNTTIECNTTTSVQGAIECLEYVNEGTDVTTPPTIENTSKQPTCYTFGFVQESSSPTTSIPCSLEKLESQEIAVSNQCTVYVNSLPDVPPSIPECPQVTVIVDETIASTIPVSGSSLSEAGSIVTETMAPRDGASNIEEGTSFVYDPFGVDLSGKPSSPFQGASTRTSQVLVQVAHYAINQGVDVTALSLTVASSLEQIPNLAVAIAVLPEALAPVDLFVTAPTDGSFSDGFWNGGSVISGSLTVSLSKRTADGTVVVGISFRGSLEASGNDGDVFWHATTNTKFEDDSRVSIILLLRGSRNDLSDVDATDLARRIAEANVGFATINSSAPTEPSLISPITEPAGGRPPATDASTAESIPTETTVWGGSENLSLPRPTVDCVRIEELHAASASPYR